MRWFRRGMLGKDRHLPPLHIFALSGPSTTCVCDMLPVNVVGFQLKKGGRVVVPALARDGSISLVPVARNMEGFYRMQESISARFTKHLERLHLSEICLSNFLVFGFAIAFPEDPTMFYLCYEVMVSPVSLPELSVIYGLLSSATDSTKFSMVESYFADDVRRKWCNEFIVGIEKRIDWPKFVVEGVGRMKAGCWEGKEDKEEGE